MLGLSGGRRLTLRSASSDPTPFVSQGEQSLGRGKGQYFHRVSEEVKEGDCRGGLELRSIPGTSEETLPEGQVRVTNAAGRR
jgi:hypothetical protein